MMSLLNLVKQMFNLMGKCRGRWMVLIDAAKGCATKPPDLSEYQADFVIISFYKVPVRLCTGLEQKLLAMYIGV